MGRAVAPVAPALLLLCGCPVDEGGPSAYDTEPAPHWTATVTSYGSHDDGPLPHGDDSANDATTNPLSTASDEAPPPDQDCTFGVYVECECDLWLQDCPRGDKCTAWANDGGNSWNASRCSPLDLHPKPPTEPCLVEGSGVSGVDDCDIYSMCWGVDPTTNEGECVAFCGGTPETAYCDDPERVCATANEGVLNLCLPTCDPILGDCTDVEGCYPVDDAFVCVMDAGGEAGAHGDGCDFLNVCDPGLYCALADSVAGCGGSYGCCTEFCDLTAADPDAACSGAAAGETCTPWFELGAAPPALAHVGACLLPV